MGVPKGPPVLVYNDIANDLSADVVAVASDANGNVFVAWPQQSGGIQIAKYSAGGSVLAGPVRVDDQLNAARFGIALRVDLSGSPNAGTVTAVWPEVDGYSPMKIVGARCANDLTGCAPVDGRCNPECYGGSTPGLPCASNADCTGGGQCASRKCEGLSNTGLPCAFDSDCGAQSICEPLRVSCPSELPAGVQWAFSPSVTSDKNGNFIITWQGNPNDPQAVARNAMARSFGSGLGLLKNDFRVDLNGHGTSDPAQVAQTTVGAQYVFVWDDNSTGLYNVYLRFLWGC